MDRHVVVLLIPIVAMCIPIAAIVVAGFNKQAKMRLEEARLRLGGGDNQEELDELRSDLDNVRGELAEVQERLDFTERLLTQSREREGLPSD